VASDADVLVLVTEWREFGDLDLVELARLMASPILVDSRNFFAPETAIAAGFDDSGIGRSIRPRSVQRMKAGAGATRLPEIAQAG
jgi:UDPglucose 6-dehydrogenase